ncbi:MAG: methyltransferase domain-containing protein [Flavobacteriia bacterium]|nr:methyltransferase domain-containing protein [Flavobacteriia bacterium]
MIDLEVLTPTEPWEDFERNYLKVRRAEGRILKDEEVVSLPNLNKAHPHRSEWILRADTVRRLEQVLKSKFPLGGNLLEVGCGNGWLSNRLSNCGFDVTGIDVNRTELEQANRVFSNPNLKFAFADVMRWEPSAPFDVVVFSAVFQYFEDPNAVVNRLLSKFGARSIYIVDTAFYSSSERKNAASRSHAYYQSKGVEEMSRYYHHHSTDDFEVAFEMIYRPSKLRKWLRKSPFPIVEVSAK